MPFGSYQVCKEDALRNACRMMKETGVDALKLEGGVEILDTVQALINAGIPVCGHLGLTPQSVNKFGGYGIRAKEDAEAEKLISDAKALDKAGCFAIVLEKVQSKMLHIERFQVNMLQENCYVVSDDTLECVIIDCGAFYPEERKAITEYIRKNNLKPVHLLVTHGHLDHNFGNDTIYQEFGLKPEVAQGDEKLMKGLAHQAETFYQMQLDTQFPPIGHFFEEDEVIKFASSMASASSSTISTGRSTMVSAGR
jgi:hypothetical protein